MNIAEAKIEIEFFVYWIAILNIIAWVLLASAGVLIARYFDSVWPEYERRVVVDGSGNVTGEKLQRRRRFSYFTVRDLQLFVSGFFYYFFFWNLDVTTIDVNSCSIDMDCILLYSCWTQLDMDIRNSSNVAFNSWYYRSRFSFSRCMKFFDFSKKTKLHDFSSSQLSVFYVHLVKPNAIAFGIGFIGW